MKKKILRASQSWYTSCSPPCRLLVSVTLTQRVKSSVQLWPLSYWLELRAFRISWHSLLAFLWMSKWSQQKMKTQKRCSVGSYSLKISMVTNRYLLRWPWSLSNTLSISGRMTRTMRWSHRMTKISWLNCLAIFRPAYTKTSYSKITWSNFLCISVLPSPRTNRTIAVC